MKQTHMIGSWIRFSMLVFAAFGAGAARAEGPAIEVEVDPIAYALSGYSVHVDLSFDRSRIDVGVFGLTIPEAVHGNGGFDASFDGAGFYWDYFGDRVSGSFFGVGAGVSRVDYVHEASGARTSQNLLSTSVRVGYRFGEDGFFVSPWISVGYSFGAEDVNVGGAAFKANPLLIFPTVHLGYRF